MPPPGPARSRGAQRRGQLRCHLRERRWGERRGSPSPVPELAGPGPVPGFGPGLLPRPPFLPPAAPSWGRPGMAGGQRRPRPLRPFSLRRPGEAVGAGLGSRAAKGAAGPAMEEGSSPGSSRSYAQRPAVGGCEVSPRSGSRERQARRASGVEPLAEQAPVVVEALGAPACTRVRDLCGRWGSWRPMWKEYLCEMTVIWAGGGVGKRREKQLGIGRGAHGHFCILIAGSSLLGI